MSEKNLSGTLNRKRNDDERPIYMAVNQLQETAYVPRIAQPNKNVTNWNYSKIKPYDHSNLYPNLIRETLLRSSSTLGASGTMRDFIVGEGFGEDINKIVVNSDGQTLFDILAHLAQQRSVYNGYALHFNYNVFGEITEINEIAFENIRWKKDLTRFVYNPDWPNYNVKNSTEYFIYNPENVVNEINEVGFEKYTGQILYWHPDILTQLYCTAYCDAIVDDMQFEAESKLYKNKNIINGFSMDGIFKWPTNLNSEEEIDEAKDDIRQSKGAKNAGRSKLVEMPISDQMANWKFFEPAPHNNVDKLFEKQNQETRENIYSAYKQPLILNSIVTSGMFNQDSYIEAFNYYNSYVEVYRKGIERHLNEIIENSIFEIEELKIIPKRYSVVTIEDVLTIQKYIKDKTLTYIQAIDLMVYFYGISDEKAMILLSEIAEITESNTTED